MYLKDREVLWIWDEFGGVGKSELANYLYAVYDCFVLDPKGKSKDIIKYAIKRMIPKGPLGSKQLSNCKIYPSPEHPHNSQNPKLIKLGDLNKKNIK